MPVTATITKDQRDGLYELVRHHLYSIDALWTAFGRSRDYATAECLALEFGEDFRLLADIGWAADNDRKSFELTMPPLDLTELLRRLHAEADKVLVESGTEREASEEDARTDDRFQIGHDACAKILVDLDPQKGESP
ncbi:MAG TPA: hypothetical protein VG816_09040 [Solirubrobacterales bacterium]|nr:hypothetical protein [Solirubrobacterales bacterium]